MIKFLPLPKSHYNHVSEAWRHIIGDNFHFGYFTTPESGITDAACALTEELAALGNFTEDSHVIDVGCGIGEPAFHLHEKFGCSITGITNSEKGVELATAACIEKGYSDRIKFIVADAQDNGLPDNHFDTAWVLESSHLMLKKNKMFRECYRVLKPGGEFILCDFMSRMKYQFQQLRYTFKLMTALQTFGLAKVENLDFYRRGLHRAGFRDIEIYDISEETYNTMNCWRENLKKNMDTVKEHLTQKEIDTWFKSLDALEFAYNKNHAGYGMVKAVK